MKKGDKIVLNTSEGKVNAVVDFGFESFVEVAPNCHLGIQVGYAHGISRLKVSMAGNAAFAEGYDRIFGGKRPTIQ